MGLYDREYMRDEEPGWRPVRAKPWSPTITLLVVLSLIFIVQEALRGSGSVRLLDEFALSLDGIQHGRVWQFFTFQFLHGGILHLVLNGMTLYSFGRFMEQELGRWRFLGLYFLSGIAGGLLQVAATWALRQDPFTPVVGASAGIAGVLAAFMLSHPDLPLIIFPLPFKIRAWTLLWIVLPLSIIGTVVPFGHIAHAAHLGGLLAGGAFLRWTWFARRRVSPPPLFTKTPRESTAPPCESSKEDFIASEVDPILEKIHAHGIHSLTPREREILAKARSRIEKR
jgi:membrane associated rhomboid family serine protease